MFSPFQFTQANIGVGTRSTKNLRFASSSEVEKSVFRKYFCVSTIGLYEEGGESKAAMRLPGGRLWEAIDIFPDLHKEIAARPA